MRKSKLWYYHSVAVTDIVVNFLCLYLHLFFSILILLLFTSVLFLHVIPVPFFWPYQVELHLKPIQSLLRHQKPLVFVLNSPQPLIWKIKTENLALGIKHTFHVSPASPKASKSYFLKTVHSFPHKLNCIPISVAFFSEKYFKWYEFVEEAFPHSTRGFPWFDLDGMHSQCRH